MTYGDPQAYSDLYKDAYGVRPTSIPEWESREDYISEMRALETLIWGNEDNAETSL